MQVLSTTAQKTSSNHIILGSQETPLEESFLVLVSRTFLASQRPVLSNFVFQTSRGKGTIKPSINWMRPVALIWYPISINSEESSICLLSCRHLWFFVTSRDACQQNANLRWSATCQLYPVAENPQTDIYQSVESICSTFSFSVSSLIPPKCCRSHILPLNGRTKLSAVLNNFQQKNSADWLLNMQCSFG